MTFRFVGMVPVLALLAVGTAHAQSNPVTPGRGPSDVGNMAYPTPLPQGSVTTTTTAAPRDTGNMAPAAGTNGAATVPFRRRPRPTAAAPAPAPAPAAAVPAPAPSAGGMAAAKALDTAPGSAPVPYVDFAQPAPMKGKAMMHAKKKPMAMKKAAMKKPAAAPAAAAPAATPAAPAPAK